MEACTCGLGLYMPTSPMWWPRASKIRGSDCFILQKLGYNLITKEEDLWIKVLRTKYKIKERIPENIKEEVVQLSREGL